MSDAAVITVQELADLLRIGHRAAYEAVSRGEIPGVIRFGRSIRISRQAIDQWLLAAGCEEEMANPFDSSSADV